MEPLWYFGMTFGLQSVDTTSGTTKLEPKSFVKEWVTEKEFNLDMNLANITQVMGLELENVRKEMIGVQNALEVVTITNLVVLAAIVSLVEVVHKMTIWPLQSHAVNHRQLFSIHHVQVT